MPTQLKDMQGRYQSLSGLDKPRYQGSQRPKYQYHEKIWLNDYQYSLYQAAMKGLTPNQIHTEPLESRRKISTFHTKAQKVLNLWKQNLINQLFEQLCSLQLNKFPQNPFNTVLNDTCIGIKNFGKKTDETFTCDITFAQLKINRLQIIKKLITEGVFPENFFELHRT